MNKTPNRHNDILVAKLAYNIDTEVRSIPKHRRNAIMGAVAVDEQLPDPTATANLVEDTLNGIGTTPVDIYHRHGHGGAKLHFIAYPEYSKQHTEDPGDPNAITV